MKTKILSLMLASMAVLNACKKETILTEAFTKDNSVVSDVTYIHNGEAIDEAGINYSDNEQVLYVASENLVYIFDNSNMFLDWALDLPNYSDLKEMTAKIEQLKSNAPLSSTSSNYSFKLDSTNADTVTLYADTLGKGLFMKLKDPASYLNLGTFDNKTLAYKGGVKFIAFYADINYGGASVICPANKTKIVKLPKGMFNKVSSVITN